MSITKFSINTFYLIIIYIYIYAPPLQGMPGGWTKFLLFLSLFPLIHNWNVISKLLLSWKLWLFYAMPYLAATLALTFTVTNGVYDTSLVVGFVQVGIFIYVISLAWVSAKNTGSFFQSCSVPHFLSMITVIESLFIVLEFLSPSFSSFIDAAFVRDTRNIISSDSFRKNGIAMQAGDGLSFALFVGFAHLFHPTTAARFNSRKGKAVYFMLISLVFFALMLTARTGIILCISFLVLYTLLIEGLFRGLMQVVKLAAVTITFIIFFVSFFPSAAQDLLLSRVLPWSLELFYSLFSQGSFSSHSTDALIGMLFLPSDDTTMLFGTGLFVDPVTKSNAIASDIGYVRCLFYWGFVGSAIFFLSLLAQQLLVISNISQTAQKWFYFSLFLVIYIANFKVPFFFFGDYAKFVSLIFFETLIIGKHSKSAFIAINIQDQSAQSCDHLEPIPQFKHI